MKSKVAVLSTGILFSALALPALASEQRVIEETLLYKDPTVAAAGNIIYGVSVEGFVQTAQSEMINPNTGAIEKGPTSGILPGINLFVGYDNFTFTYHYKSGTTTSKIASPTGSWTEKQKDAYQEIDGRWLIKGVAESFTPYLIAGYGDFSETQTNTLDSGGNWIANGLPVLTGKDKVTYTSAGVGVIIPMNATLGFRVDGMFVHLNAKFTEEATNFTASGSGSGGRYTATAYYNFAGGWNAQLGGRIEQVSLNGGLGSRNRSGVYGILGYTFR